MESLREASTNKVTSDHNIIDQAIKDKGEGYTVLSMAVGVLFRPTEKELANTASEMPV